MNAQKLINNAWDKIDQLPLDFEMDIADLEPCLIDAQREMQINNVESIDLMSTTALQLEYRIVYHFLFRLRNTTSTNFRYNTGADGRSVDKSMVSKMLDKIMEDLDDKFQDWKDSDTRKTGGKTWTRTRRTSSTLS